MLVFLNTLQIRFNQRKIDVNIITTSDPQAIAEMGPFLCWSIGMESVCLCEIETL